MSMEGAWMILASTTAVPTSVVEPETDAEVRHIPPFHVLIENDDHHTMDFVVDVLRQVFGYDLPKAFSLMMHAHEKGEAVVWSGPKEVAELKVDQIRTFHQTHPTTGQQLGPVGCRIEPAA
jgi:ATP-dependent Clp protease adaptor protein ClpS